MLDLDFAPLQFNIHLNGLRNLAHLFIDLLLQLLEPLNRCRLVLFVELLQLKHSNYFAESLRNVQQCQLVKPTLDTHPIRSQLQRTSTKFILTAGLTTTDNKHSIVADTKRYDLCLDLLHFNAVHDLFFILEEKREQVELEENL